MNFLHQLSDQTKRALDLTAIGGFFAAASLSQVAAIVAIISGLLSAAWFVQRFYDRHFLNRSSDD